jgi:membrane-associated protein
VRDPRRRAVVFPRDEDRADAVQSPSFYEKHGGKAIIIARFMPIMRTFVPVVAGIAGMSYRNFATFNIIGGASWVLSMTVLGYFVGLTPLGKHIEAVIIAVVFLSVLPGIIAWLRSRKAPSAAAAPD